MAKNFARDVLTIPAGLISALQSLFPSFDLVGGHDDIQPDGISLHGVMIDFCSFFDVKSANERQLNGLASLMAKCVSVSDALENAVGTCFLEHLRQVDKERILWRHLSSEVKIYMGRH